MSPNHGFDEALLTAALGGDTGGSLALEMLSLVRRMTALRRWSATLGCGRSASIMSRSAVTTCE